MKAYSLLDFGRVREGSDRRSALEHSCEAAIHAERLGFKRFWVAEHHNMPAVATAATPVVIGKIAEATTTIRVGAGGVMMPNHVPYILAEQFGTLETLYPGRIDLGLGRAPGTGPEAIRAMRVHPQRSEIFPQDVSELKTYLNAPEPGQTVEAVPGSGTNIPLWILGSSLEGAKLAAAMGMPYGFASHFSPQMLDAALKIYRDQFVPSETLASPQAMVCLNVIAATSDDEAKMLATSTQMSITQMLRRDIKLFQPPIPDIDQYWSPMERAQVSNMLACSCIGGKETLARELSEFLDRTQADELMIMSDVFDPRLRLQSLEIISDVMNGLVSDRSQPAFETIH